ncbi:MAG: hotdog fold thioesterase [Ketobacteraceae bacterium]|nr:hotdog fold thioesterase [Ketobacteraceae bacterium]
MSIWNQQPVLTELNEAQKTNTIGEVLGIEFTEIGEDYIKGTMPVDHRTHQPMGILHGGASVVLAESLGSMAANLVVDTGKHYCVGLDINANHLRSVRSGQVTGVARPIHLGRTTQVWEIKISDDSDKPVCISRLTMAVLSHQK